MIERRQCRFWTPLIYMAFELIGIVEGIIIVNAISSGNYVLLAISIIISIILLRLSIIKTSRVYVTRCSKNKHHRSENRHIRKH